LLGLTIATAPQFHHLNLDPVEFNSLPIYRNICRISRCKPFPEYLYYAYPRQATTTPLYIYHNLLYNKICEFISDPLNVSKDFENFAVDIRGGKKHTRISRRNHKKSKSRKGNKKSKSRRM
jgi:hypothetical protein